MAGSGYTRQSVASIVPTAVVRAAPINAEFDKLRDAFTQSDTGTTGHRHDGSSDEGSYVPFIADLDKQNYLTVDQTNNRFGLFIEVSGSPVEQLRFQDGVIVPVTDNDIDLGTSSLEYKDAYVDGTAYIDTVSIGDNDYTVITDNTYTVSSGSLTFDVDGDIILDADGADVYLKDAGTTYATFTSNSGNLILKSGNTTAVTFTGANADFAGTLDVTGAAVLDSTLTVANNTALNSNVTIGDSTTDTVTFNARAGSDLVPNTNAGYNLGSSSLQWNNLWLDGTATVDTLQVDENATVDVDLSVGQDVDITRNTAIGGTLSVTGATGVDGDFDVNTNKFTVASATGNTAIAGTLGVTGQITGNVTGDLTGNVTASSGTTTLNNLTVNGTVDFTNTTLVNVSDPTQAQHAATKNYVDTNDALKLNLTGGTMSGAIAMGTNKITGLGTPVDTADAATKGYVDTTVSAVIDAAPGALDTLNELAAALGDDPNFSTTVTNSIATKLPLAGGTMTGDITLGANKATSTATPVTDDTLTRKGYVDTQDALKLDLAGGTMTGAIAMGTNKITGLGTPTADTDAATKGYIDTTFGDTADAAASAAAAATSATNAAASYDSFDDRYLGAKATTPTLDNDGDALITGALYFDTVGNLMKVYTGSSWINAGSAVNGTSERQVYTATSGQTSFSATYDAGYVDVYLNGVKLVSGTDFTATSGTSIVLTTGATAGDIVDIVAYGTFDLADHYNKTDSDARYARVSNNLSDLGDASAARTNLGVAIGTDVQAYDSGLASIAGLTTAANKMLYTTGSDSYAVTDLSAFGRTLIDDADSSAARTTLGLVIGTDVQAYDATILNNASIGTSVQAYDSNLTSFVSSFTLPTTDGSTGQFLKTDGAGTLSFATVDTETTLKQSFLL